MVVPNVVWAFSRYRRRRCLCCAAATDDILQIAAVGGARSGTGPRFPERTYCLTGFMRKPVGSIGCRITACAGWHRCDLRWRQVRQPTARETDVVRFLRPLADHRGAAGTAGVMEAEEQIAFSTGGHCRHQSPATRVNQSLCQ
jgi:hypothetical protein